MSKKLQIFNTLVLLSFLWVVGTMPLHHHDHSSTESHKDICEHKHDKHTDTEDCAICYNLVTAQAIDQIDTVEHAVFNTSYTAIYSESKSQFWHNIVNNLLSNKDPPSSFIS